MRVFTAAWHRQTYETKLTRAIAGFSLALTGCKSIGPGTVARDRFDYGEVVGESWKSQMLLKL